MRDCVHLGVAKQYQEDSCFSVKFYFNFLTLPRRPPSNIVCIEGFKLLFRSF